MGCSATKPPSPKNDSITSANDGPSPVVTMGSSPAMKKKNAALIPAFLKKVPLFQNLPQSEILELAQACEITKYAKGEAVIKAGDVGKEFFLISEGEASVLVESDEKVKQVATLKAGDYFGEGALLHDQPRQATIVAATVLKTLIITRSTFEELDLSSKVNFPCRKAVGAAKRVKDSAVGKEPSPKTAEDKAFLTKALKANQNLETMVSLTATKTDGFIEKMWKEDVKKGTALISQGDINAHYFYVVQAGKFDVIISDQVVDARSVGESFGELAMLYSAPRAATVKAVQDSVVWVIDRTNFKQVLMQEETPEKLKEYVELLTKIPLFAPLLGQEREAIARTLTERTFVKGKVVIQAGDQGASMFILTEGDVSVGKEGKKSVSKKSTNQGSKVKKSKSSGTTTVHCFGEQQLISADPRNITVTVTSAKARMLMLDRDAAAAVVGPLEDLLGQDSSRKAAANNRVFGQIKRKDLVKLGLLGCGGFGAVELVEHKTTKETYALKQLSKGYIVESGMESSVMNEKNILMMADSIFIIRLYETYNGTQSLYFLMEAALGGELYATYNRKRLFGSEPHAKFYVAGAVCAFEYLHRLKIVYRDLKPENMILDVRGHVKLIDMGLAKVTVGKTFTACGTPDYFAPEIITQTGHTHAVDWWCVGILTFELTTGTPPFEDEDPMQTYAKIKKGIDKITFPESCKGACQKFVRDLVQQKPENRLPIRRGGVDNIRNHEWYSGFGWQAFMKQELTPPYKPAVTSNRDMANFKANDSDRPAMLRYDDPGTGWDQGFATCGESSSERVTKVPSRATE